MLILGAPNCHNAFDKSFGANGKQQKIPNAKIP